MVKRKTDLQEILKRDCADSSRFAVWGQQWGDDNYAANSNLAAAGGSESSFPATPEAATGEDDTNSAPSSSSPVQSTHYGHEASPSVAITSASARTTHTQLAQRHSSPAPFRSPLLPPSLGTAQTSGEATYHNAPPSNARTTLSSPIQQRNATVGGGHNFTTHRVSSTQASAMVTGRTQDIAVYNSTFRPQATPSLQAVSPRGSNGPYSTRSNNTPGAAARGYNGVVYPARSSLVPHSAAGGSTSQMSAALPMGASALPPTPTARRRTIELPPAAPTAYAPTNLAHAQTQTVPRQNIQTGPAVGFGPTVLQQVEAVVAPEPDAPAASTQSTSPRQPDGLLWAGPPEEDLYQEWMNLPDQFFDILERTAHTQASQAPQTSGNAALNPWFGDNTYSTSSQQDDSPVEQKDW